MKMNRNIVIIGILTCLSLALLPAKSFAAPTAAPAAAASSGLTGTDITNFLTKIAKQAISFVLVIAAIFIMLAGYLYITSMGNTAKVEQAKQMLLYVVIGVLVVMGAWLAVNEIVKQITTG